MATGDRTIYSQLQGLLFTDNAIAGEAAAIAMGLVLLGTGNGEALQEMLQYSHDTKHEKIIRKFLSLYLSYVCIEEFMFSYVCVCMYAYMMCVCMHVHMYVCMIA